MKGSTKPIGIFDSGVGGLTVLKALRERMPDEQYIQLTDASDRFLRIASAILGRDPEHLEIVDIEGVS